jgi:hypothetical protein
VAGLPVCGFRTLGGRGAVDTEPFRTSVNTELPLLLRPHAAAARHIFSESGLRSAARLEHEMLLTRASDKPTRSLYMLKYLERVLFVRALSSALDLHKKTQTPRANIKTSTPAICSKQSQRDHPNLECPGQKNLPGLLSRRLWRRNHPPYAPSCQHLPRCTGATK